MRVDRQLAISTEPHEGIRRCRRYPVRIAIRVFALAAHRRLILEGISNDLCQKGMALFVPVQLEIGQEVQIDFRLPTTHEKINLTASVRDCDGFRCGVEFRDLTKSQEITLAKCCEQLAVMLPERRLAAKTSNEVFSENTNPLSL